MHRIFRLLVAAAVTGNPEKQFACPGHVSVEPIAKPQQPPLASNWQMEGT